MMNSGDDKDTALLAVAQVPDLLPDIPGGENNLLPRAALENPLTVIVPKWPVSHPTPEEPETLELKWNDAIIESLVWEDEPPAEIEMHVRQACLTEGEHRLHYEVLNFEGDRSISEVLPLIIDTTPPVLGSGHGKLTLVEDAEEVERDGLTERYLENHGDRLRTEVPLYGSPRPGDTLIAYWDTEPYAEEKAFERQLAAEEIGGPYFIDYPSELIIQRGDGRRYLYYAIQDRAGNMSNTSTPLILEVSAATTRMLPPVEVSQASGSAPSFTLDLDKFIPPLVITIPEEAVVYPGETVTLFWGESDDYGYFCSSQSDPGSNRCFEVPLRNVVGMSGRTSPISYEIDDGGRVHSSAPSEVLVRPIRSGLPVVQVQGASSGGLSLSTAPARIPVKLGKWRHIALGQLVNIWVTGVVPGGRDAEPFTVLSAHAVIEQELREGIGERNDVILEKTYLSTLWLDQQFTLNVSVSFDDGEEWLPFPSLSLVLSA
ncbi:hypothetical protein [Pseudomonas monteilii]|uniref:hypothetical protein n=1 Tax=Pseudomonas monteilii TaxID=76759 RepID=UPI0018AAAB25|nr:hypothetical protein [Pseudomonas monteilii]MBF8748345.1 hypothetical protein [Pseudomonas monteilii]